MKRLSFLPMLLITLLGGSMWGQDRVWNLPDMVNDTTIVRQWKEEEYIMYCRQGGMGKIVYHNNVSDTAITSDWFENFYLNDMRIVNDMVYGGGYVTSPKKRGMLACFSIYDFLESPNDAYKYIDMLVLSGTFPPVSYDETLTPDNLFITEVRRLAIHEESEQTWVAYIADNIIQNDAGEILYRRSGYGDAIYLPPSGWWAAAYHYNKDGAEIFTDLCTTDNKIVIVGRDTATSLAKVQVFDRVASYASAYGALTTTRYVYEDYTVHDRIMVTSVGGDGVALAHHCVNGSGSGLVVKVLDVSSGVPSLLHSQRIDAPTSNVYGWRMMDLVYCPNVDRLMILNKIDEKYLGFGCYIHNVELANIAVGQYYVVGIPLLGDMHSLDNFESHKFIVSGKGDAGSVYNGIIDANHPCGMDGSVSAKANTPTMRNDVRHHGMIDITSTKDTRKTFRMSEQAIIICGGLY